MRNGTAFELERQQANLTAPITGIVTSKEVKVGDHLPEPGKPVVEIAEQKGFHFEGDDFERRCRSAASRHAGPDQAGSV